MAGMNESSKQNESAKCKLMEISSPRSSEILGIEGGMHVRFYLIIRTYKI
jgi:hypothetical protein